MSDTDSISLDNTKKDLIGAVTAVVFVSALLRTYPPGDGTTLDSHLSAFVSDNPQRIKRLVDAVLSAGLVGEIRDELLGTLSELVPRQSGYYDRRTTNALLSLYAGEPQMKDFCAASEGEFHAICKVLLTKKLTDLVTIALWCRVQAYERGVMASEPDLSKIYVACLALLPDHYREELDSCEEWQAKAKAQWRQSNETQRGIKLTGGADSGLTKLLSQI